MKRVFTTILAIILLFSWNVSFAEDSFAENIVFTLHNGTKFGMSQTEIISEEFKNGFLVITKEENLLYGEGTIAGREKGATISYFFEDEKMFQMRYLFYLDFIGGFNQADYKAIDNGLTEKYGQTIYSSDTGKSLAVEIPISLFDSNYIYSDKCPITGQSINNQMFKRQSKNYPEVYSIRMPNCQKYKQWFIQLEDGSSIVIDHSYLIENIEYFYETTHTGTDTPQSYEQVIYTKLSKEETEQLLNKMEKVNNDL